MRRIVAALALFLLAPLCLASGMGYRATRPPPTPDPEFPVSHTASAPAQENEQPTAGLLTATAPKTAPTLATPQAHFVPLFANNPVVPFTFIAWADTKTGLAELVQLSNMAAAFHPAFTLFSGDLETDGFTAEGMSEWVNAMDGQNGNGMAGIVFPVRGNHDGGNRAGWQQYFSLRERADALGMANFASLDEDLTYSFDYANAHFIGLDVPGNIDVISGRQVAFVDQDLAAAEARGLDQAFLFFHGPVYPTASHASCEERVCALTPQELELIDALNRHPSVAGIFNGHEHLQAYVHLDQSRIPEITHPFEEFVSGSAGAEQHSCVYPARADYCEPYSGFVVVRVEGKNYSVSYYRLGQDEPVVIYAFTHEID